MASNQGAGLPSPVLGANGGSSRLLVCARANMSCVCCRVRITPATHAANVAGPTAALTMFDDPGEHQAMQAQQQNAVQHAVAVDLSTTLVDSAPQSAPPARQLHQQITRVQVAAGSSSVTKTCCAKAAIVETCKHAAGDSTARGRVGHVWT